MDRADRLFIAGDARAEGEHRIVFFKQTAHCVKPAQRTGDCVVWPPIVEEDLADRAIVANLKHASDRAADNHSYQLGKRKLFERAFQMHGVVLHVVLKHRTIRIVGHQ